MFQIWTGLIKQLKVNYTVFTGVERAQLIDDAFTLFMAGIAKPDDNRILQKFIFY